MWQHLVECHQDTDTQSVELSFKLSEELQASTIARALFHSGNHVSASDVSHAFVTYDIVWGHNIRMLNNQIKENHAAKQQLVR